MATFEQTGLMTFIDENGNQYILYPVTNIDAVDGLLEALNSKLSVNSTNKLVKHGGDEGGEVFFEKPDTTDLAGDVAIDIWKNEMRFWEAGGTVRGASIDFTKCEPGVSSKIYHTGFKPTASDVGAKAAGAVESIATGGTGAKTYQKAMAALSKPQIGDWRTAEVGISAWYYESADTTAYNLPFTHCIVLVIKRGANRGTAIAFGWNVGAYHMWRSVLHDDAGTNNWSNWVDACNAIGAEPADTYNNKKVHKKVINMGAIANGDTKVATGINYNQVIRWSGVACNAAGGATICLPYNNTDGTNIRCLMVLDEFIISANTAAYANYNAEITIWYTD